VVLAAEMRGLAKGDDVCAVLDLMEQGQAAASRILSVANAMTDVTGFGLAGHLAGICEASDVAAEIELGQVPWMPGALALAGDGIQSTLYSDNRGGAGPVFGAAGPKGDLLFDPQTAGGLLACVPRKAAADLLDQLRAAGYVHAAIIGRIVAGAPSIKVL
jgi:selenide,water dikinase